MDKSFWNQRPLLLLLEILENSQKRFKMQKEERRLAKEIRNGRLLNDSPDAWANLSKKGRPSSGVQKEYRLAPPNISLLNQVD